MQCEIDCDSVDVVNNDSDKKVTEIPSELISVAAECRVTVVNFSRNCLTAVPTGSVHTDTYKPACCASAHFYNMMGYRLQYVHSKADEY